MEFVGQVLKSGPGPVLLGIMSWSGSRLLGGEPIGDRKISDRDSHVRPGPHRRAPFPLASSNPEHKYTPPNEQTFREVLPRLADFGLHFGAEIMNVAAHMPKAGTSSEFCKLAKYVEGLLSLSRA